MKYLSVCSGIEAASVAWQPLGWEPVGFSEIEKFPCAVLSHRFPGVKNFGDMTKFKEWENVGQFDVLVGGTPCQSFSVAGLRAGLADPRGNLMLTFGALADHFRPTWIVWENVPGVLSSNRGRDFGTFLGMLGELGYGTAYRVLDAQYFNLAQRRERVFVVGYLGDWRRAAAVLFESEGLQWNPPPSREAEAVVAALTARGVGTRGADDNQGQAGHLIPVETQYGKEIAGTLTSSHSSPCADRGQNVIAFSSKDYGSDAGRTSPTIRAGGHATSHANAGIPPAIAFNARQDPDSWDGRTGPIDTDGGTQAVLSDYRVRRLTPRECERLQGFPDDWTLIPWREKPTCPDGLRYKAIGNSMAVPVMRWIGERIRYINTDFYCRPQSCTI